MSEEQKKRARINRYKKIIMYTFVMVCVISIILWIFICHKIVQIDDRINDLMQAGVSGSSQFFT